VEIGKHESFSIGTFKYEREAHLASNKAEERNYYGQTLKDRKMLFEDVAKEWLFDLKKPYVKESPFEQIEVIIRLHVLPYSGRKKIMTINRKDIKKSIEKFGELNKDGKEKYSYGSRLKYLSVMKSVLHYAVYEIEVLKKTSRQIKSTCPGQLH
jgi:hypothetical protein